MVCLLSYQLSDFDTINPNRPSVFVRWDNHDGVRGVESQVHYSQAPGALAFVINRLLPDLDSFRTMDVGRDTLGGAVHIPVRLLYVRPSDQPYGNPLVVYRAAYSIGGIEAAKPVLAAGFASGEPLYPNLSLNRSQC